MIDMVKVRKEHPEPQFERAEWINLNGQWEFEIDYSKTGKERAFYSREHLQDKIIVPFCPESELSGVNNKDFMPCVWYRRDFEIPETWANQEIFLHFGAVDYESEIYINGESVKKHRGGSSPFKVNITRCLRKGKNSLCVCAEDDSRDDSHGRGKQSDRFLSYGCCYTRVTGIWQTVWLECVPQTHIENVRFYPNAEKCSVGISIKAIGKGTIAVAASYKEREMGRCEVPITASEEVFLELPLKEKHVWTIGDGNLYDVKICFEEDNVKSYFGLRSLKFDGFKFLLNGKSVFQRLVLDQGYYPDGIYTAPDDGALQNDILLAQAAGFNGARLHQKVFEPRFLYHADKLGYLVWGEYGDWGADISDTRILPAFIDEWTEIVERDFNHPCIVGWCPFNETWDHNGRMQNSEMIRSVYRLTKKLDTTRPCIDVSGFYHTEETDVFDMHDYTQDPAVFAQTYRSPENMIQGFDGSHAHKLGGRQQYRAGLPVFVSEYGGIRWAVDGKGGWGYGDAPDTEEEFIERYKKLTEILLSAEYIFGFCYTQLYDVEQETNGIYTYGRKPKFNIETIRAINEKPAAIEKCKTLQ